MLNIYLLRHGQTQWNLEGNKYCGRTDLPLTQKGVLQAQAAGAQLKRIVLDAVYSSPLQRAFQTAQIAGGGRTVIKDDRIIEADFGLWEGKTKEEFIPENETLWKTWMADPQNTQAGGTGETAGQVIERVSRFFESLVARHADGNILVVGHNGVNRFYLAHKLGMHLKNYRKLTQENSTITLFQLDAAAELTLVHLNSRL